MSLLATPGIARTSRAFREELVKVGERLAVDPNFIAAVISNESGFNPQTVNPTGGATGLIQFMPATAKAMGTTTAALRAMSDVQQLAYVERFYRPHAGKIGSPGQCYMATFLPAFMHKPSSFVLGRKGDPTVLYGSTTLGKLYEQNAGFDATGKGYFDVGDVTARADATYRRAIQAGPFIEGATPDPKDQPALPARYSLVPLPLLQLGSCGPAVVLLQASCAPGIKRDGLFGPVTQSCVRARQASAGIPTTGIVDAATWGVLVPWRPI